MGANKLFRSDDRGNSWQVISEDLTRNEDRNQFQLMGKYWPSNAVAKDVSTSLWGTIVSLAESTVKEGLLYVGTDDGLVQVTEDDGKNWRRIEEFPGVPKYSYISGIFPSRFDENIVFVAFNRIKSDDFKPYLLKSTDKGKSWTSITANLPENETIHTIMQDTKNENLLFVGTEFSFYFSVDGGTTWVKFNSGLPDISVKDIVIQERENDLVIATFGRGFYILDDYTPLRHVSAKTLDTANAIIFPIKDALMYVQSGSKYRQGSTVFSADNPEFGAIFTYYLKDVPKTKKQERIQKEEELFKKGEPIPQPTKEQLAEEENEISPVLVFTITDANNNLVRKIYKNPSKGINRIAWNLRYQGKNPARLDNDKFDAKNNGSDGMYAMPGTYKVSLALDHSGETKHLAGPDTFVAKTLNNTTLPAASRENLVAYQSNVSELSRVMQGTERFAQDLMKKNELIRQALHNTPKAPVDLSQKTKTIAQQLKEIMFTFNGTEPKASSEEVLPEKVSLNQRLNNIAYSHWSSTSDPTQTQLHNYEILKDEFPLVYETIKKIDGELKQIEIEMEKYESPWTPGRLPDIK